MAAAAPPGPPREGGEIGLHCIKHSLAAERVEGVVKVQLHQHLLLTVVVAVGPGSDRMDRRFNPRGHRLQFARAREAGLRDLRRRGA